LISYLLSSSWLLVRLLSLSGHRRIGFVLVH
jgi:hypothetical protein